MTERFMVDDAGTLIDMTNRNTYDYVSDVCDLLNELAEENENITLLVQHNYEECKRIINNSVDKIKELEKENKELKGKLEVYRELYPTGKWITKLTSEELEKELEE